MFFKIGVLKNFINFTEKHMCWESLKVCDFIEKRLQQNPLKFAKFLRKPVFKEYLRWLLLQAKQLWKSKFLKKYSIELLKSISRTFSK